MIILISMRYIIFIWFIIVSCIHSKDYYNSDRYKIKMRQEESLRMMEKTHDVRRKCSPRMRKSKGKRKHRYYS